MSLRLLLKAIHPSRVSLARPGIAVILIVCLSASAQPSLGQLHEITILKEWDEDLYGPSCGFGASIGASNSTLAVGAPCDSEYACVQDAGAVYVFRRIGSAWLQGYKEHHGGASSTYGYGVAVNGRAILAGAPYAVPGVLAVGGGDAFLDLVDDSGTPDTYADRLRTLRLSLSVSSGGDAMSASNDLNERWIAVSREAWNDGTGAVEIYRRDGSTITHEGSITAQTGVPTVNFGRCLALSGDVLAVGSREGPVGSPEWYDRAVYVFRHTASGWHQETQIKPIHAPFISHRPFVDVRDDDLIIGGSQPRIYHYDGAQWNMAVDLAGLMPDDANGYGPTVLLHDRIALVGAPDYRPSDESAQTGAIFVFEQVGNQWRYRDRLLPLDTSISVRLGTSLAATDDFVFAGGGGVHVFRVCPGCSALTDMQAFQSCFGTAYVQGGACGKYDFTGDGVVGADDFAILAPAMTGP